MNQRGQQKLMRPHPWPAFPALTALPHFSQSPNCFSRVHTVFICSTIKF